MSKLAISTRDDSQDSLLGETTNVSKLNLNHCRNTSHNSESIASTRDESFDSLLGEKTNEIPTTTVLHQTKQYKHKSRSSKISTGDESYDSLLGETNNETPNQSQNKSKINNSNRKQFINSILESAIAKTNAESTRKGKYP